MAGVFISYRRSDSAGHTGRLADDLAEGLGEQQLFRDIEAIEAGEDFVEALNRAVAACSVMLVVIGPTWARVLTADGKRRLHQPDDFVRLEIEAALGGGVRIIPVLVGDAQMPLAEDLPESMLPLLRRNAYMISDRRWQYDIDQLIAILEKVPGIASRSRKESDLSMPAAVPPQPLLHVSSTQSPAPSLPQTSSAGAQKVTRNRGIKVVIAGVIGLVVLLTIGLVVLLTIGLMIVGDDPASAPSTASSAGSETATTPEKRLDEGGSRHRDFAGLWRSESDSFYLIEDAGETLTVITGDAIDPVKTPNPPPPDEPPSRANFELIGEGVIDGDALNVTLTDRFSGGTETLILRADRDGRSLVGTVQAGNGQSEAIVLERL